MPQHTHTGLRRQCLGFKEVLGGALGGMGLSGTVIIGVPIIFAKGGPSTSLMFLTAMFAFLLVALQINVFASRIATHGSLYDYVRTVFGARAGAATGWILLLGYAASVPAYLASVPYTLIGAFKDVGGASEPGHGGLLALAAVMAVLASWLSIRNVTVSTRAILTVEVVSLGLLVLAIGKYVPELRDLFAGMPSDLGELRASLPGLALAMVCFTGFEGASVFGTEAKRPLSMIPRANLATVLVTGVVTVVASGAVIGAYHRLPPAPGANPFSVLIAASDLHWGLPVVLGAAVLSWLGCLLASLNAGGRLLYTLAQQGRFWNAAGRIHPRSATPFIAIIVIAVAGMATTAALILGGIGAMDVLVGAATLAAACFLLAYALVSAAALVHRWRSDTAGGKLAYALMGALTITSMLLPIIGLTLGAE